MFATQTREVVTLRVTTSLRFASLVLLTMRYRSSYAYRCASLRFASLVLLTMRYRYSYAVAALRLAELGRGKLFLFCVRFLFRIRCDVLKLFFVFVFRIYAC